MARKKKQYNETLSYDSLDSYMEHALSTPKEHQRRAWTDTNESFRGTKDMDESVKIANEGFELDKIQSTLDGISSNDGYELRQSFQVSGGEVEMGMYMEGIPECMIDFDMIESKQFIHLVIGIVEAGRTQNEQILNRAAAICSIVDQLESDNYRVRLTLAIACEHHSGTSNSQLVMVDVKDYKQPMAIASLAGVLHTGFFRRIVWSHQEGHKWGIGNSVGSTSISNEGNVIEGIKQSGHIQDSFIFLPSITEHQGGTHGLRSNNFKEFEDAARYAKDVQENLDKLTVQV